MKWTPILLLICALPVQAEIGKIDGLGVEAQQRRQWCWAAVSVMSIRSFNPQGDFHPLTQVQLVARREVGVRRLADVNSDQVRQQIAGAELNCAKPDQCGAPDEPLLFDIDSDFV